MGVQNTIPYSNPTDRNLRFYRLSKGYSQSRLAKAIGTTQPRISQIELGMLPRREEAEKISMALGDIPVDILFPAGVRDG